MADQKPRSRQTRKAVEKIRNGHQATRPQVGAPQLCARPQLSELISTAGPRAMKRRSTSRYPAMISVSMNGPASAISATMTGPEIGNSGPSADGTETLTVID